MRMKKENDKYFEGNWGKGLTKNRKSGRWNIWLWVLVRIIGVTNVIGSGRRWFGVDGAVLWAVGDCWIVRCNSVFLLMGHHRRKIWDFDVFCEESEGGEEESHERKCRVIKWGRHKGMKEGRQYIGSGKESYYFYLFKKLYKKSL